jgi:hypothetical protein
MDGHARANRWIPATIRLLKVPSGYADFHEFDEYELRAPTKNSSRTLEGLVGDTHTLAMRSA